MVLKKLIIESSDSVSEIMKTLNNKIVPRSVGGVYLEHKLEGYISGMEFNVSRLRHTFMIPEPILEGKVFEKDGKSIIDISCTLSIFHFLFFLSPCVIPFVNEIFSNDQNYTNAIGEGVFFSIPILIYLFICIKLQLYKAPKLLLKVLSKHSPRIV